MRLPASSLLLLSLAPMLAGASTGTLHFRGALVEPTCQAEVLDGASLTGGRVAVRLFDCRATPLSTTRAATVDRRDRVSGSVQTLTLSGPVAQLAGRAQLDMLTFIYE